MNDILTPGAPLREFLGFLGLLLFIWTCAAIFWVVA